MILIILLFLLFIMVVCFCECSNCEFIFLFYFFSLRGVSYPLSNGPMNSFISRFSSLGVVFGESITKWSCPSDKSSVITMLPHCALLFSVFPPLPPSTPSIFLANLVIV